MTKYWENIVKQRNTKSVKPTTVTKPLPFYWNKLLKKFK